jgi:hypothetical protein
VNSGGRKSLNIPVTVVCDTLRAYRSADGAAKELGCSRPYLYKILKAHGLKMREVIKGQRGKNA